MKSCPLEGLTPWGDVWLRSGWTVQQHARTRAARLRDPVGQVVVRGTAAECVAQAERLASSASTRRAVILLHGLWHHRGVMQRLEGALAAKGWAATNVGYSSRLRLFDEHAATVSRIARTLTEDGATDIAFIGHSLGGLVARAAMALAAQDGWRPGPLVVIGSPAHGAQFVKTYLEPIPLCKTAIGACRPVLIPNQLVPLPVTDRVFVIAGGNAGLGYNPLIDGDNDWLIGVDETRLPGFESRFLLVPAMHRTLPGRDETIAASVAFLEG